MEIDKIDRIIDKHHGEASSLLQILLDIQSENSWLPKEALVRVSERLNVPMTRIQHIATFYKAFSLVPKGRHKIHICMGTACHVRGAPRLLDTATGELDIKAGETTEDGAFSLDRVNCLGCCALGPVVLLDGVYHDHMTAGKLRRLIASVQKQDKEGVANDA